MQFAVTYSATVCAKLRYGAKGRFGAKLINGAIVRLGAPKQGSVAVSRNNLLASKENGFRTKQWISVHREVDQQNRSGTGQFKETTC